MVAARIILYDDDGKETLTIEISKNGEYIFRRPYPDKQVLYADGAPVLEKIDDKWIKMKIEGGTT